MFRIQCQECGMPIYCNVIPDKCPKCKVTLTVTDVIEI